MARHALPAGIRVTPQTRETLLVTALSFGDFLAFLIWCLFWLTDLALVTLQGSTIPFSHGAKIRLSDFFVVTRYLIVLGRLLLRFASGLFPFSRRFLRSEKVAKPYQAVMYDQDIVLLATCLLTKASDREQ
ncbi:MAG: hypothetical protein V4671_10015 [Armatimonadota bacterium]